MTAQANIVQLPETPRAAGKDAGLADHVTATIDRRLRDLIAHEAGTRTGTDPEDLHQMRVAVRRMRAVLKQAAPALDPEWTVAVRDDLGRLGTALGAVRDADVLIDHFTAQAAALPAEYQPAMRRLVQRLRRRRGTARTRLLNTLDGDWYPALLDTLTTAVVDGAPVNGNGDTNPATAKKTPSKNGKATAAGELGKPLRRLRRSAAGVAGAPDGPDTDEQLHALRIKVKRLRYTTEMLRATAGKPAKRLIRAATELQDVLGEHQDACVAQREILAMLQAGTTIDMATAFAAGRLMEREEQRRMAAKSQWPRAWQDLDAAATTVIS